ncbi:MAG: DUF6076 domain-containing protein [Lachnospiraceae bacterium]|nr:DUF6076 domain-containing protein [Lachnospiraceae bacterium]
MMLKDGLYLFPDGKGFTQIIYSQFTPREIGSASSGHLLIDFLDFDLSKIFSLRNQIETLNGSEISDAVSELDDENAITYLIRLMTGKVWANVYIFSAENSDEKYKVTLLNTLNSIIETHDRIWELADYYCVYCGSTEEKFDYFHAISEQFTTMSVEEIISARKPGMDFFGSPSEIDYSFPYTRAYRFTDLENYVQFLFLDMMRNDSYFSKCNYCYNFFIPKTKKPTRFCDRIDSKSGKTCKEIAPTVYRNDDVRSNAVLNEYDRAIRRNYKRMCRAEEREPDKQSEKDIDPQTYFDWRDRALKAMRLWKNKKLSVEELLKVVKELD